MAPILIPPAEALRVIQSCKGAIKLSRRALKLQRVREAYAEHLKAHGFAYRIFYHTGLAFFTVDIVRTASHGLSFESVTTIGVVLIELVGHALMLN